MKQLVRPAEVFVCCGLDSFGDKVQVSAVTSPGKFGDILHNIHRRQEPQVMAVGPQENCILQCSKRIEGLAVSRIQVSESRRLGIAFPEKNHRLLLCNLQFCFERVHYHGEVLLHIDDIRAICPIRIPKNSPDKSKRFSHGFVWCQWVTRMNGGIIYLRPNNIAYFTATLSTFTGFLRVLIGRDRTLQSALPIVVFSILDGILPMPCEISQMKKLETAIGCLA